MYFIYKTTNEKSWKTIFKKIKAEYISIEHVYIYIWLSMFWIHLKSTVCARMLTMKHWFRVSFIFCRYKACCAYRIHCQFFGWCLFLLIFVVLSVFAKKKSNNSVILVVVTVGRCLCIFHMYLFIPILADQHRMKTE